MSGLSKHQIFSGVPDLKGSPHAQFDSYNGSVVEYDVDVEYFQELARIMFWIWQCPKVLPKAIVSRRCGQGQRPWARLDPCRRNSSLCGKTAHTDHHGGVRAITK